MFDETQLVLEDEMTEEMELSDVCEGYLEPIPLRPRDPEDFEEPIEATDVDTEKKVEPEVNPFVLGKIRGPVFGPVGVKNGNGRIYLPTILDAILTSPYVNQMMQNKCLLGEAHHPADKRGSIFMEEAAISWTKLWKEGNMLYGEADILDTERGRLVHLLTRYGSKLGVSARAGGRGVKGSYMGEKAEIIKPELYDLKTFDVVLNPGFAMARPEFTSAYEEGDSVACLPEEFFSEFKTLLEEGKLDKEFARSYIDYCEDENMKSLLPLLEESTDTSEEDQISSLTEENERLRNELEIMNTLCDSLREEAIKPSTCSDGLVEELMSLISTTDTTEPLVEELLECTQLVNEQNEVLSQKNHELFEELIGVKENIDSLNSQVEEQLETISSLNESIEEYESRISNSQSEYEKLEAYTFKLSSDYDTLNEEVNSLRDSLAKAEKKLETYKTRQEEAHRNSLRKAIDMSHSIVECMETEHKPNRDSESRRALINNIKGGL